MIIACVSHHRWKLNGNGWIDWNKNKLTKNAEYSSDGSTFYPMSAMPWKNKPPHYYTAVLDDGDLFSPILQIYS
jgi:hypothetical protein